MSSQNLDTFTTSTPYSFFPNTSPPVLRTASIHPQYPNLVPLQAIVGQAQQPQAAGAVSSTSSTADAAAAADAASTAASAAAAVADSEEAKAD